MNNPRNRRKRTTLNPTKSLSSRRIKFFVQPSTKIVEAKTVSGSSLLFVVTIMTFLTCLAVVGSIISGRLANSWINDISKEITIQVISESNVKMDERIDEVMKIILNQPGVSHARVFDEAESIALIKPWIDSNIASELFIIPRIIAVEVNDHTKLDLPNFRYALEQIDPQISIDDHNIWIKRLSRMSIGVVLSSIFIMILLLVAMALSVISATRAALSSNREVVEVLHFVGASDRFIASEFQNHFLSLGLRGGLIGGGLALLVFSILEYSIRAYNRSMMQALSNFIDGNFGISLLGYTGIALVVLTATTITALTSRYTVYRLLKNIRI